MSSDLFYCQFPSFWCFICLCKFNPLAHVSNLRFNSSMIKPNRTFARVMNIYEHSHVDDHSFLNLINTGVYHFKHADWDRKEWAHEHQAMYYFIEL